MRPPSTSPRAASECWELICFLLSSSFPLDRSVVCEKSLKRACVRFRRSIFVGSGVR